MFAPLPSVGSIALIESPTSVTRELGHAGVGSSRRNGCRNSVSSSIRSTSPRSAGCQEATPAFIASCSCARGVLRPLRRRRERRARGHRAAELHVGSGRVELRIRRDLGGGAVGGLAGNAQAERQHHPVVVAGDHEPVEQHLGQLGEDLVGHRRSREQAQRADRCRDDLHIGQQPAADRRADAVGTHQHVALDGRAVGQLHLHAVVAGVEIHHARGRDGARRRVPPSRAG